MTSLLPFEALTNPHWFRVLNVALRHGYVFGRMHAETFQNGWAFRFTPDLTLDPTLPDEECAEVVLFNHDPNRLIAALNIFGQVGCWTPGARLFQIQHGGDWYTFDMSREIVSPCESQRESKNELHPMRSVN